MKSRIMLPAFFFLLLLAPLHALGADPRSAEGILSFADSLLKEGESYRASTEYMRALHFYSADPALKRRALEGLAATYAYAGRFDDAAGPLSTLAEEYPDSGYRARLGEALYRAGRNLEAADLLLSGAPNEAQTLLGTLAWLKTNPDTPPPPPAADKETVRQFGELPAKSPTAAGVLSALLPGAGHLYVDRPHDALVAFVLNGLFIWGTAEAVDRRDWGLTAVLGTMELFWYSGTIVGSVNGAHKWNQRERDRFFEAKAAPLGRGLTLWGTTDSGGLAYTLKW